ASSLEGCSRRAIEVPVAVPAPAGRVTRVKLFGDRLRGQDRHVFRETRIERSQQTLWREPPIGLEAGDLAFRVGACVSASRPVDHVVLAGDRAKSSLQLSLHRTAPGLLLPAGEV